MVPRKAMCLEAVVTPNLGAYLSCKYSMSLSMRPNGGWSIYEDDGQKWIVVRSSLHKRRHSHPSKHRFAGDHKSSSIIYLS